MLYEVITVRGQVDGFYRAADGTPTTTPRVRERLDYLIRLNIATGLAPFIAASEAHTALTVIRFKEFCGDLGPASDVLSYNFV